MSRTRRLLGGLAVGYANQILLTLAGLWLTKFLLGRVGQSDYGLWIIATQLLSYLLLLDLGVVALLPRETAFAIGRAGSVERAVDLAETIGRTARLVLWQMPLVVVAAVAIWLALPAAWRPLEAPLAIVMVAFVATFPARVFEAVLQGLQDLAFLGIARACTWLLGTGVTVGLVLAGFGLYALALGWIAGQCVVGLVWWLRLRRRFPTALPARLPSLSWPQVRAGFGRGLWVSMAQVAQVLLQGTELLIIGKLLGATAVVPYFCTAKLVTVLGNQPLLLAQSSGPALSELRMGGSRERIFDVCTALTQAILLMSGAIVCVVLLVNQGFVMWWVGTSQYGGFVLTVALLAAMALRHWNAAAVYSVFSFGHDRRISLTNIFDGIATASMSAILVWKIGVVGAAIASITGVCLVSLPGNLRVLAREMSAGVAAILRPLWPWFWRFAVLAVAGGVVGRLWIPHTLPRLIIAGGLMGIAYVALMLPLALRPPLGVYVRPRLAPFLKKFAGPALAHDADA